MNSIITEYGLSFIALIVAIVTLFFVTKRERKFGKYETHQTTVQREVVFLIAFVHEKDKKQIIDNYFHKEVIDKTDDLSKDVDTYGTFKNKILPALNKRFVNVRVLNIQKLQGRLIYVKDIEKKNRKREGNN